MNTIVISYRRHDSRDRARALLDRLARDFPDRIGMGLEGLLPGENFRAKAQGQLHACRVLLVLIGPGWAQLVDERGRPRLHDKRDWVRLEISVALQRQAHVVPVLIDGAAMPDEDELPPELHPLLDVQPLALPAPGDAQTEARVTELATAIRALLGEAEADVPGLDPIPAPAAVDPSPLGTDPASPAERVASPDACPVPVWASAAGEDALGRWADLAVGAQVQRLRWIPPGTFLMGGEAGETERFADECPQHEVTITHGFWLADTACTQALWETLTGQNPSQFGGHPDHPVDSVRWDDVTALFLPALNSRLTGAEAVLPTEAQWEYACRAGTTTATSFGDKLSSRQANFKGKPYNGAEPGPSLGKAAKVGSYPANAWGLHDLHGNIYEWCRDWYHRRLPGGSDPDLHNARDTAARSEHGDVSRARRGGCWADEGWPLRTAFRLRFEPHRRYDHIGFRIVAVRL